MQIIRGTTPTITVNVRSNIDLNSVTDIWVYFYQSGSVIIDKQLTDVAIDTTNKRITFGLTQEETLALKADTGALFQIRILLSNNTALATLAANVAIKEIYKGGIIGSST